MVLNSFYLYFLMQICQIRMRAISCLWLGKFPLKPPFLPINDFFIYFYMKFSFNHKNCTNLYFPIIISPFLNKKNRTKQACMKLVHTTAHLVLLKSTYLIITSFSIIQRFWTLNGNLVSSSLASCFGIKNTTSFANVIIF